MGLFHQFQKLLTRVRQEGVSNATIAATDHARRTISEQFVGLPGYYRGQLWRLQRRYDQGRIVPMRVSPREITHLTGSYERRDRGHLDYVPHFKPRESNWDGVSFQQEVPYGTVMGGNWDRERVPFSKLLMYRGAKQRFIDGRDWEDTVYYTELTDRFREQGWDNADAEALTMERCDRIETIYERIERDGYRSQRELNGHPLHEVTVTVGRDGELLYNCEGRHRLSIAKLMNIETIPVIVLVRHENFDGTIETDSPESTS